MKLIKISASTLPANRQGGFRHSKIFQNLKFKNGSLVISQPDKSVSEANIIWTKWRWSIKDWLPPDPGSSPSNTSSTTQRCFHARFQFRYHQHPEVDQTTPEGCAATDPEDTCWATQQGSPNHARERSNSRDGCAVLQSKEAAIQEDRSWHKTDLEVASCTEVKTASESHQDPPTSGSFYSILKCLNPCSFESSNPTKSSESISSETSMSDPLWKG